MRDEVDQILNRFTHFGVELGLERIERLLAALGNPHQQVPILHVAGSNGKGSVCAYLSSVLTEAGYRVGRYTSPHLVDWTERICINNQEISPSDLYHTLTQVLAAIQPDKPSPTQFEVITAAAWLYFAQQQVDIAVIEVGLGGRLDATNVCDRPLVSVITSLSREHWQRLGPTLADISREKAGILKPHCPAVLAPLPTETEPVLYQRLADLECPAFFPKPSLPLEGGWALFQGVGGKNPRFGTGEKPEITLEPFQYPLPLPGAHQLTNSALAIATFQLLRHQGWEISDDAMRRGMANTQWQGRMQWVVWNQRPLLIDGAHNSAGAIALRHYVDTSERVNTPVNWVMGMLENKDHDEIFRALLRPGDRLFLTPVPDHLTADIHALATLAQQICPQLQDCQVCEDAIAGLTQAFQGTQVEYSTILCGSLYLIGDFFRRTHLSTQV